MIIIKSWLGDLIINPDSIFWQNRGPEVDPITGEESEANKDLCFMVMARKSGTVEALTGRTTKKQARDIIDVIAVTLESNVTDMTESNDVYIDMVDVVYSVQCGKNGQGKTSVPDAKIDRSYQPCQTFELEEGK